MTFFFWLLVITGNLIFYAYLCSALSLVILPLQEHRAQGWWWQPLCLVVYCPYLWIFFLFRAVIKSLLPGGRGMYPSGFLVAFTPTSYPTFKDISRQAVKFKGFLMNIAWTLDIPSHPQRPCWGEDMWISRGEGAMTKQFICVKNKTLEECHRIWQK